MWKAWIAYLVVPVVIITLAGIALYFRIAGDIAVCRTFYKEMGVAQCYFSSKTVRVPQQ